MSAPEPLSAERLAEIRNRRLDEVTPGPWLVSEDQDGHPLIYVERTTPQRNVYARVLLAADGASEADVQFVASARRSVPELIGEVERLNEQAERRRVRLAAAETDLLNVRGALSPNGFPRKVPMELGETVTPAVEWLIGEVERLSGELAKYVDKEPTVAEEMQYLSGCLTAVHDLCDAAEKQARRWESPLPIPEWVEAVRQAASGDRPDNPDDSRRRLYVDGKGNAWIDSCQDVDGTQFIRSISDTWRDEEPVESVRAETGSLREIGRCW